MSEQIVDIENIRNNLPPNLLEFVDPNNPRDKRLMAAQGVIPLGPKDLAQVLFCLIFDSEEDISEEAKNSLFDLPENVMSDIISDQDSTEYFLDYIARNSENDDYIQAVLLNPNTSNSTYSYLARSQHSQVNIEIISSNNQRILSSIDIVEALSENPSVSRSTLDKVLSFISLYLEKDESVKKFFDKPEAAAHLEDEVSEEDLASIGEIDESFLDDVDISEDLLKEFEEGEATDAFKQSVLFKIKSLSIAEKLKAAIQGNMETRRILVRDSNRIVSGAVLRNPRLSDMEIVLISQSKVVDEEILRQISEAKKWIRLYQVKSALVNNPKTPLHISMNFLKHMRPIELKSIQFNRNLPVALTTMAKKMNIQKK